MKQRWKSKFLALILVVIMTLGMLPAAVQAAGGTGTTGIWKWKILDDGTLGITGCTTPSGGDLILPASLETGSGPLAVTSIEANAFKSSSPLFFPSDIKTFVMPDSVTRVGDSAFYWCNKLTSVTLSANLRTMGASAFYNCTALTSITLPDTLESIGASALANCSVLRS
ncbi:MAG: leucine-rich repeat domain-containing protein, partial [Desulfitobacterium hafniense]|nr:leucine-rich repeat domain-containing protein [Desulfitobacterium hafniense]